MLVHHRNETELFDYTLTQFPLSYSGRLKSAGGDNTKTDVVVLVVAGVVVAIGRTAVLRVVVPVTTTQQLTSFIP